MFFVLSAFSVMKRSGATLNSCGSELSPVLLLAGLLLPFQQGSSECSVDFSPLGSTKMVFQFQLFFFGQMDFGVYHGSKSQRRASSRFICDLVWLSAKAKRA